MSSAQRTKGCKGAREAGGPASGRSRARGGEGAEQLKGEGTAE